MIPLLVTLLTAAASAESELVFSPDRPGLGESGATPGPGHFMFEGGVSTSIVGGLVSPGTSSLTARLGVFDNLELRLALPDLTLAGGVLGVGPMAVGMKLASGFSERVTVSLVPELLFGLDGSGAGLRTSANAGMDFSPVSVWLNATTTVIAGTVSVVAGGGVSVAFATGGIYLNAGREFVGASTLLGGGGWWGISDQVQIDIGVDVWLAGTRATTVPMLGVSVGI